MAQAAHTLGDPAAEKARAILEELLEGYGPRDFAIEFWDGSRLDADAGKFCRFTWRINHPGVFHALARRHRQVALGEAFIYGQFDIAGDLLAVFPVAEYLEAKNLSAAQKLRLGGMLLRLPGKRSPGRPQVHGRIHSPSRDRQAVGFHYDLCNDFYRLWLDREMVYSCAYFDSPEDNLDSAQADKLDYICRKLRLRPQERLLDIGCGWGGLVLHAARYYRVHAIGITLSTQQCLLARQRIDDAGLGSLCQVELLDYRQAYQLGQFDKLVSVGMVEHVGERALDGYFQRAFAVLKPGGVFLNHGIGRAGFRGKPKEKTFTDAYVFPDGELVPISTMLAAAEHAGFEVRDVENLREHYFLTLCHWLRRLEQNQESAQKLVGELRYRIWRLYLAGSAYYFHSGKLDLYQSLVVKPQRGRSGMPLRRADWYS